MITPEEVEAQIGAVVERYPTLSPNGFGSDTPDDFDREADQVAMQQKGISDE